MTRISLNPSAKDPDRSRSPAPRYNKRHRPAWWLHPFYALTFLTFPLLIAAYLMSESTYLSLYRTDKSVDLYFVALASIVYLGFVMGSFFAFSSNKPSQEYDILAYCRWVVWPLFLLTILGYIVWFGYNITRQGFSPIVEALSNLLFTSTSGTSDYLKGELFETLPGVTTILHLCVLYATVEALLFIRGAVRRRTALIRFGLVASFVLAHALLLSERLVLIEIATPAAIVLASKADMRTFWRKLVKFAPLVMAGGAYALFTLGEYFRSWTFYRVIYSESYLQFAAERFLGYYTTAINNAAAIYYNASFRPLGHTFESVFEAPVIGEGATEIYETLFGVESFDVESFNVLSAYANPEFNNIAPVGLLLNEYSILLAPVAAFLIAVISVSLYRGFAANRLIGVLLYPSWFIGLLEISRVYFWASQRYFPTLVFLVVSLVLFKLAKTPVQSPIPSTMTKKRTNT